MQPIPVPLITLVAGIVITIFSYWLGQNHGLLPLQASQQAPLVDGFFNLMFSIATALFIVVEGTILMFVWKYRRRSGDNSDGVPVEGSIPLEIFWTAIPTIIVICLGIYSVDVFQQMGGLDTPGHLHTSHHGTPGTAVAATMSGTTNADIPSQPKIGLGANPNNSDKQPDVLVNVTGMQFAWLYEYPNLGVGAGELHVPVGADVQLNLSATDVIHSFWVPQFRIKQDAIPGVPTQLRFVATVPGTYPVVCTELCGAYHGSMRSQVVVHTPEDFQNWVTENSIAQGTNSRNTVAVNPLELSNSEYLASHTPGIGVSGEMISHLLTEN
ncbi:cytochrome c oxidase subunit II [Calothrix sp. 336/3]|uniref:cytochrome c oxidase subunit II n=1 Tax=Calothrix sp. 336/3 TaxID=1337936 RepID=UPI0004E41E80|nr:cytochrome c oxidase subunit II [Calothrix sp. 336/3]AKG22371.1 cytochrome C oxidase subunit II [Calothrix sp. 336/3]